MSRASTMLMVGNAGRFLVSSFTFEAKLGISDPLSYDVTSWFGLQHVLGSDDGATAIFRRFDGANRLAPFCPNLGPFSKPIPSEDSLWPPRISIPLNTRIMFHPGFVP